MNPHLDHLKQQLSSVKAEIRLRTDNINRLKWEVEELEKDKAQLIMDIEQAKLNRFNPCLERAL